MSEDKWISVEELLPQGTWTKHEWHKHLSEDVLICNSCATLIGRWNREENQ
jgi:hypothetical protein